MACASRPALRVRRAAHLSGRAKGVPATTRKYNPGFLADDELVASFCVRTHEFDSMIEMLRECTGSANPHRIVIGPRGSGKTSLLLRVAAELCRDTELSCRFFPVVFAEESYEVATAGEFWLEALSRLAAQAPGREDGGALRGSWEDLRTVRDDRVLGERCLGALLDFADREGKRLVLVVENLNAMFADMTDPEDAGWRLRKTLQTEPRILVLASATSRFDAIDNPERALYDLFRVHTLRPLDTDECAILWASVSGRSRVPDTIRALRILTGGSPRLLAILARFGAGLSFRALLADLLDLVDDHTEYFRSHLETLPAQERRVYLALADLWKPATAREIADRARLDTSKCSAQLARLADRGAIAVVGGGPRRKLYDLSERLYNIYYLMRRARGSDPLVEALVRFMASNYAPAELKDIGLGIAREAGELDTATHESPEERCRCHLIRAMAILASGDRTAGEQDVAATLVLYPDLSTPQWAILNGLKAVSLAVGPRRMRELIVASPSADLLLPLTTALECELGIEPRVAREVAEVAEDIRRDFRKLREGGTHTGLMR